MLNRIVIAGGSLAGFRAFETLRRKGYHGEICIVGDETEYPYDRPPLSKQILAGAWPAEYAQLAPSATYADGDMWYLGRAATSLDLKHRRVALSDGTSLAFDGLVITTGARPRWLFDGEHIHGVHVVRSLVDALRLRDHLDANPDRVLVIGAGFVGTEVAAACRSRSVNVTLVDPLITPLARVLPPVVGDLLATLHRENGVDLRLGVQVDSLRTAAGSGERPVVRGVTLSDGTHVDSSAVVIAVGAVPNTAWLEGCGLTLDDGLVCDETCLAAPGIVAAGDVARWKSLRYGRSLRVEHWSHAAEQASYAARRLLALDSGEDVEPFDPVPYFWSDQFGLKIQMAGDCSASDDLLIVSGSFVERRFVALLGRAGRVTGVLGFNFPGEVMKWRKRLSDGVAWEVAVNAALAEEVVRSADR